MKKLLDKFADEEILIKLFELYPNQKKSIKGYENTLKELRKIKPKKDKMKIRLEYVRDNKEEYVSVDGYKKGSKWGYALDFTPFNEWLGMDITEKTLKAFSELDIMAHCLWEMTFHGYSNEKIQEKIKEIDECAKRIKKGLKEGKTNEELGLVEFDTKKYLKN